MSKNKLNPGESKVKFTISMNRELYTKLSEVYSNKSKLIEYVVYQHMKDNNKVKEIML